MPVSYRLVWSRTMGSDVTVTGSEPSVNGRDGKRQGCRYLKTESKSRGTLSQL